MWKTYQGVNTVASRCMSENQPRAETVINTIAVSKTDIKHCF